MAVTAWRTFNSVTTEIFSDSSGNTSRWNGSNNVDQDIPLVTVLNSLDSPNVISFTDPNSRRAGASVKVGDRSPYLTLSGLSNLAIPSDAAIVGVELMINRSAPRMAMDIGGVGMGPFYYTVYGTDLDVRLAVDGVTSSNMSLETNWINPVDNNGYATRVDYLGSSSSLFGVTITPANAGNLVVTYSATATLTGASDEIPLAFLAIDYFAARYHYTTGGTTPPSTNSNSITTTIF